VEWRSLSQFRLTFFGLTLNTAPQVRVNLFTQIHEIVFHGNGGYDWHTIYNMPIWLRKFTFSKLRDYHSPKDENNVEKSINNLKLAGLPNTKPPISKITPPSYITKASKK
jgi:hypothetical protein